MTPKEICPICYNDSLNFDIKNEKVIITCSKCYYKHTKYKSTYVSLVSNEGWKLK